MLEHDGKPNDKKMLNYLLANLLNYMYIYSPTYNYTPIGVSGK